MKTLLLNPAKDSVSILPSHAVLKTTCFSFLAFLLIFCCSIASGFSQNSSQVDISNYYSDVVYDGARGDTITYTFILGKANAPSTDTKGYDIEVKFPNMGNHPDVFITDLSGSWLGSENAGLLNSSYNHNQRKINVGYLLNGSNTVTGYGALFEVKMVRQGGFTQNETQVLSGGGMVIVVNADFKTAPVEEKMDFNWTVFPNPTTDVLRMNYEQTEVGTLTLMGLDGSMIYKSEGELPHSLEVANLSPGMYLLHLDANGLRNTKKVMVVN